MSEMSGQISVNVPTPIELASGETIVIVVKNPDGTIKSTVLELTVPSGKHFTGMANVYGALN